MSLLAMPKNLDLSFPRKRESSVFRARRWVPDFAGTTIQRFWVIYQSNRKKTF